MNNNSENLKKGYIKLYRSLLEWEWYDDKNVCRLFTHCLLRANHADRTWHGQLIRRGSFITSYEKLSTETNLTVREIRTALNKLKMTNEVTCKSTSRNTTIIINNFNFYQPNDIQNDIQNDNETTNKRQTNDNKQELKELNNNNTNSSVQKKSEEPQQQKKFFKKPTLEEIKKYISEKKLSIDGEKFFDYYEANGWKVGRNQMKSWKSALNYWQKTEKAEDSDYLTEVENAFRKFNTEDK